MKTHVVSHRRPGFTLIELLVVIAIIGVLAGLLLPTLAAVKRRSQITTARMDIKKLELAVTQYESDYSRLPAVSPNPVADLTFGPVNVAGVIPTNSDVVATLLNVPLGFNLANAKNPRQIVFYKAAQMSADPIVPGKPGPVGVSTLDYQARDPWGTPYVISLDLNYDGNTQDALYSDPRVSEQILNGAPSGINGLVKAGTSYVAKSPVMIWSLGPDRQYDATAKANAGANKDNILSWYNK